MIRRHLPTFTLALILATIAAAITHGEFHAALDVFGIGIAGGLLFFVGAVVLAIPLRTRALAPRAIQCGFAFFLAIPLSFATGRIVVAIDLWRAKHYVETTIAPQLEQYRATHGRYPQRFRPPNNAPWLVRRFDYGTNREAYTLGVRDPGLCGRVTVYSSAARAWRTTYDPCFY